MKKDHSILIGRMLTGEMTDLDNQLLAELRNNHDFREQYEAYKTIWNASHDYFPVVDWNKEAAKTAFLNKINTSPIQTAPQALGKSKPTTPSRIKTFAFALAIAMLIGVAALVLSLYSNKNEAEIKSQDKIEYALLPDNSEVWLGVKSVMSRDFTRSDERIINLQGSAVFQVAKDEKRPFIVQFADMAIEVTGTTFKVVSSPKGISEVEVRNGQIKLYSVKHPRKFKMINTGERAFIDHLSRNISISDIESITPIQGGGNKTFKNVSVDVVLDDISTRFGITLRYNKASLSSCRITSFSVDNMNLKEIFDAIQLVHPGISVKAIGENIYRVENSGC